MTTRYVDGTGAGSNAYNGLAAVYDGVNGPKATLNGVEDTPVAAGDLVHVRPATYRETLTIDVSGSSGNAIEYRGDFAGAIWPTTAGQVVRISAASAETTLNTRTTCVTASGRTYRTFTNMMFDGGSDAAVQLLSSCQDWIIDKCVLVSVNGGFTFGGALNVSGATQARITLRNSIIIGGKAGEAAILFQHTSQVNDAGHVVERCLLDGPTNGSGLVSWRIGGITVRQSSFRANYSAGVRVTFALTGGQTMTVNRCIFWAITGSACKGAAVGDITEDANAFSMNGANRENTSTGANSVNYPPGWDMRPYFAAMNGGTLVMPWLSLAPYSALVEYVGGGSPATDIRGHAQAGSVLEWGPEEYVSTYGIAGGGLVRHPGMQGGLSG